MSPIESGLVYVDGGSHVIVYSFVMWMIRKMLVNLSGTLQKLYCPLTPQEIQGLPPFVSVEAAVSDKLEQMCNATRSCINVAAYVSEGLSVLRIPSEVYNELMDAVRLVNTGDTIRPTSEFFACASKLANKFDTLGGDSVGSRARVGKYINIEQWSSWWNHQQKVLSSPSSHPPIMFTVPTKRGETPSTPLTSGKKRPSHDTESPSQKKPRPQ